MSDYLSEIQQHLADALEELCDPDERLFSTSRLDSLSLTEVVAWLHGRYGVEVRPEDLSLANFDTARRLASYLEGLLGLSPERPGQEPPA